MGIKISFLILLSFNFISCLSLEETKLTERQNGIVEKINFLKSKGYSLVPIAPGFFDREIYTLVYYAIYENEGVLRYTFKDEGIIYTTTFLLDKPDEPNFYVTANFKEGDKTYWFLKINYFLEYHIIKNFINSENGEIITYKIFY
jgi:hypothetical protein